MEFQKIDVISLTYLFFLPLHTKNQDMALKVYARGYIPPRVAGIYPHSIDLLSLLEIEKNRGKCFLNEILK